MIPQVIKKSSRKTINIIAFAATLISLASLIFWGLSWWKTRKSKTPIKDRT